MKWFYIDESITSGDRRVGPVETDELKALKADGKIKDTTLVWHRDMKEWAPWSTAFPTFESSQKQADDLLQDTLATLIREKTLEQKAFAGFWIRSCAFLIDVFLLSLVGSGVSLLLNALGIMDMQTLSGLVDAYYKNPTATDTSMAILHARGMYVFIAVMFLVQSLYSIFFHARYSGTVGKMLLHLRVEKADGSHLGFKGAVIRYAFSLISEASLFFYGIGYLIAAVDPQKRALHDFFAKTRVVHSDVRQK